MWCRHYIVQKPLTKHSFNNYIDNENNDYVDNDYDKYEVIAMRMMNDDDDETMTIY